MEKPILLKKNQVILTDEEKIIAVYPYRDSDTTKITSATRTIHLVTCGVPNIEEKNVIAAYELCAAYLKEYVLDIL